MSKKNDYDAIIIGAGISGLVCGCYLAKAGMKTLIVEKNAKVGGYCTSFKRKGFVFDACAHSIGGVGRGGITSRVLKEINIDQRIKFKKYDPLDIIYSPDFKVSFWADIDKTISELQENFPRESKNIAKLFHFINNIKGLQHIQLRKKTLKELLDSYIHDDRLKSLFSFLAYGNLGLPPSLLSAFIAVKFYKQFIFDGGYYPGSEIQEFPNTLAEGFNEYGGKLLVSKKVKSIIIVNKSARGIIMNDNETLTAKYIISNCDAMQTFFNLIGKENVEPEQQNILESLIPSVSFFVLYLGIENNPEISSGAGTNIWYLSSYDLDKIYSESAQKTNKDIKWFMCRIMPNNKSMLGFTNAPYCNNIYWQENKEIFRENFIKKIENLIPGLSEYIVFKDAATPQTLHKWTLNYRGAAYGWAGMPSQFAIPELSKKTSISNLYLTGHWTTLAPGIPGVVYIGRDTANLILRRENNKR